VALIIAVADPDAADVRGVLERHLAFAREVTPPGHVHALDTGAWSDPDLTFFGARRDGSLLGVGAIRRLDAAHAELKSMHTRAEARGQGVGRAMLDHLLRVAETGGYRRVSLETGTSDAFAAARSLYLRAGFRPCAPFGQYTVNPHSVCMTLTLAGPGAGPRAGAGPGADRV
jgi:putative acetyltransferase